MKFCEFAQALAPLISDGKRNGLFVQTLFENIVEYDYEDKNIIFNKSEDALKSYYSGKRDISEVASALVGHINKDHFVDYLETFSDEIHEEIFNVFSPFLPQIDKYRVASDVADLFENILIDASSRKRGRKPANYVTEKQKKSYLKESYLLDEAGCRCPLCGKRLLIGGSKEPLPAFVCQNIIPAHYTQSFKVSCESAGFKFPDPDSLASLIALCPTCAMEYCSNPTPEMYTQLMSAKYQMRTRAELTDTLDRINIEDGIIDLLNSLGSLGQEYDFTEASKNAIAIAKKIYPEERLLENEVSTNVLLYYRFIEEKLQQLNDEGILDFEQVCIQIRGCFLRLDKAGFSQSQIVESMAKWLADKTGFEDILACRVVVAFFIQACEVFREITE